MERKIMHLPPVLRRTPVVLVSIGKLLMHLSHQSQHTKQKLISQAGTFKELIQFRQINFVFA